ncbi:hypothetical protein M1349_02905 [Patescibacteria group bacterium]|nr:hypothetical protein [Patescibacteria group bacterium]
MSETAAQLPVKDGNNLILTNSLLTREELDEFKELVFKEYGIRLSDEQAFEQATALLLLVDTLIEKTLANRRNRVNISNNQK